MLYPHEESFFLSASVTDTENSIFSFNGLLSSRQTNTVTFSYGSALNVSMLSLLALAFSFIVCLPPNNATWCCTKNILSARGMLSRNSMALFTPSGSSSGDIVTVSPSSLSFLYSARVLRCITASPICCFAVSLDSTVKVMFLPLSTEIKVPCFSISGKPNSNSLLSCNTFAVYFEPSEGVNVNMPFPLCKGLLLSSKVSFLYKDISS